MSTALTAIIQMSVFAYANRATENSLTVLNIFSRYFNFLRSFSNLNELKPKDDRIIDLLIIIVMKYLKKQKKS